MAQLSRGNPRKSEGFEKEAGRLKRRGQSLNNTKRYNEMEEKAGKTIRPRPPVDEIFIVGENERGCP